MALVFGLELQEEGTEVGEGGVQARNEAEDIEKDPVRMAEKSAAPECAAHFQRTLGGLRQKGWESVGHVFLTRAHEAGLATEAD
jgi:hypothetical protein